jgi:hypothetical protein
MGDVNKILVVAAFSSATILVFGAGILIGRQFPAHHYEKLPESPYLMDTTSGKICTLNGRDPFNEPPKSADEMPKNADGFPELGSIWKKREPTPDCPH